MRDPGVFSDTRRAFAEWRARVPTNSFESDAHLALVNRRYLEEPRISS